MFESSYIDVTVGYTDVNIDISVDDSEEIIYLLRKTYEEAENSVDYMGNGVDYVPSKWPAWKEDIMEFSKSHTDKMFTIYGFDATSDPLCCTYILNGRTHTVIPELIYPPADMDLLLGQNNANIG